MNVHSFQMNSANEVIMQERCTEKLMLKIDRLEDMLSNVKRQP